MPSTYDLSLFSIIIQTAKVLPRQTHPSLSEQHYTQFTLLLSQSYAE